MIDVKDIEKIRGRDSFTLGSCLKGMMKLGLLPSEI